MKRTEDGLLSDTMSSYSDRRLMRKLKSCRRSFRAVLREVRPGKRRFAHYQYLQRVYSLYSQLQREGLGKETSTRIGRLCDLPNDRKTHLVRTIINATSTGIDAKTASRWSQALRYCWRQRDEWSDLQGFIRTHGGIAGCASACANRKRQARTGKRARRDRSEKHHIAQPNADKSLMAMERLRRSAESFAR